MDPNQQVPYNQAQQPAPQVYGVVPPLTPRPVPPPPPLGSLPPTPKRSSHLLLFLGIGVIVVLIIIIAVALLLSPKKQADKQTNTPVSTTPALVQKANSLDIEQVNNAISQQVSGLNTDQDFPANQLNDQALGL